MKRREKAEKTAASIIESAFNVIAEHSISGTSTSLIAKGASVSKPLLHYHFKTKEAILGKVLDRVLDRLLEIPLENANKNLSAFDEFKAIFVRYKETITSDPSLLVVFYDFWVQGVKNDEARQKIVKRFEAFRGYLSQLVREGVESGEFSSEKSHMVPAMMISLLEGASFQLISDPQAFNYDLYQYMALEMIGTLALKEK